MRSPSVALLLLTLAGWGRLWAADASLAQDIAFTSRCDGSIERYVLVLPGEFRGEMPHDLLVVLHGHGADRWQFVRDPRDECRAARDAAAERGMMLVSPDYRAKTSWMGPKAEADVLQILEEIKARYRIGKTIFCGGSMGGSSALTFAALHPELVDGVVSMNGTANHLEYEGFQEAIRQSFGGTKAEIPEQYKNRSAEYWPERLTMPIAITTGGRDTLVPPDSVLRLAGVLKKLGRPVHVLHRPDQGHATNYADGKAALDWVIERSRGMPPAKGMGSPRG
ncbi:MAG: alpha/beta fold hydrolase [Thermoguttaceae bacterium]|jgi:pimeloyl-ACP methyl ester carboxylesterase|nr:alpha/beta fold hydrolase [Thermoguttaceae bacterium]